MPKTRITDFFQSVNNSRIKTAKVVPILYSLYFDGGSRGNPGYGAAGYTILKNEIEIASGAVPLSQCTNNEAEYMGLINGLMLARNMNIDAINVYGDSLLVINQVIGKWKCNAANLKPLLISARNLVNRFEHIQMEHIPREKNSRADLLANEAMDATNMSTLTS